MYWDSSDCREREGIRWGNGGRRSRSRSWNGGKGLEAMVGGIPASFPGAGRRLMVPHSPSISVVIYVLPATT